MPPFRTSSLHAQRQLHFITSLLVDQLNVLMVFLLNRCCTTTGVIFF